MQENNNIKLPRILFSLGARIDPRMLSFPDKKEDNSKEKTNKKTKNKKYEKSKGK